MCKAVLIVDYAVNIYVHRRLRILEYSDALGIDYILGRNFMVLYLREVIC